MALFAYRDRVPLRGDIGLLLCIVWALSGLTPATDIVTAVILPYMVIYLALGRRPFLPALTARGDISYGVYIYAFPIEQLAALRDGTDGSISVGGAALATQLLRAGLLDELLLYTHPAILGFGRPLFDDYDMPIDLDLLEQQSFKQRVTMHRYAIRDAREASPC